MDEVMGKPLFNIEVGEEEFWSSGHFDNVAFPGLDAIINAVPTIPPWTRPEFLERHFELVDWETWRWWPVAVPGTENVESERSAGTISILRLSDRPVIVAVISPWPWWVADPAVTKQRELRFYRLKWHLWWRKVDPTKDAKLRAILGGAMALDALAGRDP